MSASENQNWNLEERRLLRTPCHADPIRQRFGDYEVRTWGIDEQVLIGTKQPCRVSTYLNALKLAENHPDDPNLYIHGISIPFSKDSKPFYLLEGNLSVSRIKEEAGTRKKYYICGPEVPVINKVLEWKGVVPVDHKDQTQLYQPRHLADLVVADLEDQGIELNPTKTKNLLDEALKPYVNRALSLCVDRKCFNPSPRSGKSILGNSIG